MHENPSSPTFLQVPSLKQGALPHADSKLLETEKKNLGHDNIANKLPAILNFL